MTYTAYNVPGGGIPTSIAVGPDQNIWFTVPSSESVDSISPTTGAVKEYPLPTGTSYPSSVAGSIVSGPGGDLWFVGYDGSEFIASVAPTTGAIQDFPIGSAVPAGLAVGSDGNLWFTDKANGAIGTFNPTTHATTEYPLPNVSDVPGAITPGPGGHLWFTVYLPASFIYAIGDIDPTTHAITLTELTNINAVPVSITKGPDQNVWFNEQFGTGPESSAFKIASISPATHSIAEYAGGSSGGITTGPDGDLWYDDGEFVLTPTLGTFNPSTHVATSFPLPGTDYSPVPGPTIVTGPDGNL